MRLIRTFKAGICGIALIVAPLALVSACGENKPAETATPAVDWAATVNEWIESDLKANPSSAFYVGREDYAGQLPDWSEAGLAAEIKRLHDWKSRVEAIDAAALTDPQKFERD